MLVIIARTLGQTVACKRTVNCNGDSLGTMPPRNCCVNTPQGFAYVVSNGSCIPCIGECPYYNICTTIIAWSSEKSSKLHHNAVVFGFFEESFSGIEQRSPHTVQIGNQKGAQIVRGDLEIQIDVGYIEGTASKYAQHKNNIINVLATK